MNKQIFIIQALLYLTIIPLYADEDADSLAYHTLWQKIQANEEQVKDHASVLQTAAVLAENKLYGDALDLLKKIVLEDPGNSADHRQFSSQLSINSKTPVQTKLAFMARHNNIKDINERELTSTQRDSISLLKRYLGGFVTKWIFHPQKLGIRIIQPELYLTNIVLSPVLRVEADFFDNYMTLKNRVSLEKAMGKFSPKNENIGSINTDITTEIEQYTWIGVQKDSLDLFMNVFQGELSNKHKQKKFTYSLPIRWSYMLFRTNKPMLSSRATYALLPFTEYRFTNTDLIISGSWYWEYFSYFNDGRDVVNDTVGLVNASMNDKVYNNPEITCSWFFKKVHLELSQSLLWEYYPNREYMFEDVSEAINDSITTGSYFDTIFQDSVDRYWTEAMQNTQESRWWESQLRFSYRPVQWLNAKLDLSFLQARDKTVYIRYYTFFEMMQTGEFCETKLYKTTGTGLKINPAFEFRLPRDILLCTEYLIEHRQAPILEKLNFKLNITHGNAIGIMQNQPFQWANYTAQGPTLSFTINKKRFYARISETFRYEKVKPDSAYIIADSLTNMVNITCSSAQWRTRWYVSAKIFPPLSLSFHGIFESKNYDLNSTLYPIGWLEKKRNFNLSLGMEMNVTF